MSLGSPWDAFRRVASRNPTISETMRRQPHLPMQLTARNDALHSDSLPVATRTRTPLEHHKCQRDDVVDRFCNC